MKVEINEPKKAEEMGFPKLMICIHEEEEGLIVLMIEKCTGIVIFPVENKPIGYQSSGWLMKYFQDFEGSITLSND